MSTVLTDKAVKSRKQHVCCWCGEKIEKGELYKYQTGIFCGEFYENKLHKECDDAALKSWNDIRDDGFEPYQQKRGKTYEESHQ
jgi:hypothetical protein